MFADTIYFLCFVACLACAVLFLRSWLRLRLPLLFWSALTFTILSASNGILLVEKVFAADSALTGYRLLAAFLGATVLFYGLYREAR